MDDDAPSWLTDPEFDREPADNEWGHRPIGYVMDSSECDHPLDEVMTNPYGHVMCHQCGMVVEQKPLMHSDEWQGISDEQVIAWQEGMEQMSIAGRDLANVFSGLGVSIDEMTGQLQITDDVMKRAWSWKLRVYRASIVCLCGWLLFGVAYLWGVIFANHTALFVFDGLGLFAAATGFVVFIHDQIERKKWRKRVLQTTDEMLRQAIAPLEVDRSDGTNGDPSV